MAHQNHGSQMLTANRLVDGDVLYRKGGGWVLTLADGDVYDEAAEKTALAAAQAETIQNTFVAPYLFEVRVDKDVITPVKEREIIRAAGPTVRTDLGKQASGIIPPPARLRPAGFDAATSPQGGGEERDDDVSI